MNPCLASFDETLCCWPDWRDYCVLSCVALYHDPPAEYALPADRHGLWEIVAGHVCAAVGGVVAAHCVCFLGSTACGFVSEANRGNWVLLGSNDEAYGSLNLKICELGWSLDARMLIEER